MPALVLLALMIDAIVGDPRALWSRVPHPVAWFGRVIDTFDQRWNDADGKGGIGSGFVAIAATVVAFAVFAAIAQTLILTLLPTWLAVTLLAAMASIMLAHHSLHEHIRAVLDAPDLPAARQAVSMIVGRDTAELDEAGVSRAAIETLAESLSDGVVAPAFWLLLGGLPGIVAYKVVNTADSMIGHRTPRHEAFGKAAARLDDLMNFIPARLTALILGLVAGVRRGDAGYVINEAKQHVSPNAGYPEAVIAEALGVSLGGPRSYSGRQVHGVWFNDHGDAPDFDTVREALRLSRRFGFAHAGLYGALALLAIAIS